MINSENEIWKDVPNYVGIYKISNLGNVFSIISNKVLKPAINNNGYLALNLYGKDKLKRYKVHQLVAMAFLNHIPNGSTLVVNHINYNRLDNKLCNLEVVTMRENSNKKHIKSKSKYIGVYFNKNSNKWYSQIYANKKRKHLGTFDCELKAHLAYQKQLKTI